MLYSIHHALVSFGISSKGITTHPQRKVIIRIFVFAVHLITTLQTRRLPVGLFAIHDNMICYRRYTFRIVPGRIGLFPNNIPHKTILAKYIIHHQAKITHLVIINGNKYSTSRWQEFLKHFQSGIHHAKPFIMATEVFTLFPYYFAKPFLNMRIVYIIIIYPPLIACIIRRIDIYAINSSFILWQQRFQGNQIIPMNNHIATLCRRFDLTIFCRETIFMF